MILSGLVGNETAAKVLLFLENYSNGYAREISLTFSVPISQVQRQLERIEREGIIVSRLIGKTRQYSWNPRWGILKELKALLAKTLQFIPEDEKKKYFFNRSRPRRRGKPL